MISGLNHDHVFNVLRNDQTSSPLDIYMISTIATSTLSAPTVVGAKTVQVTSATGITAFQVINLYADGHMYQGLITNVTGTTLTVSAPLDRVFPSGSSFRTGSYNMNVNGSVTPQIFSVKAVPGVRWDTTRLIISMTDNTSMAENTFGGLTSLPNGLVCRKKDHVYTNLFQVNDNAGIGERTGGVDSMYVAKTPAGVYGLRAVKTWNGDHNHGTVIRLDGDTNEELQMIVQDDLTGLIKLAVIVQGHVTQGAEVGSN